MTFLTEAVNRQIDQSIFANPSNEEKLQLAKRCDFVKKASIIAAIVAPVFAFFLPYVFGFSVCFVMGLIGYDLFNAADNLGDAARLSAEGGSPPAAKQNIEILLEGTLAGRFLLRKEEERASRSPPIPIRVEIPIDRAILR